MIGLVLTLALAGANAASCAPGVYLAGPAGDLVPLGATAADHRKVAGLGGAMLGPFAGSRLKVKTVIPGAHAATRVRTPRPSFRLCFAAPSAASGSDYVGVTEAGSPGDYRLVRLESGDTQRELLLSRAGGFGGPKGAISEAAVAVRTEQIAARMFQVDPATDLPPGEYGFLLAAGKAASARKKDVTERVFDFGVE